MTPHQALHLFRSSKTTWELLLGQVASPISRAPLGYRQHWHGHLTSSLGAGQSGSSSSFSVLCFCTMPTHRNSGEVGWRCEGPASILHCVWWWPGHWLCMTSTITPAPYLKLVIPNSEERSAFHLPTFLGRFQETKSSKTCCGHDHRIITEHLQLYWVYRYIYLCPLFSSALCFSGLKAAGHFLSLLLRADVPNSNHILLKNVRVVRGRLVNAFQSPLLFPLLNCRSRETTDI